MSNTSSPVRICSALIAGILLACTGAGDGCGDSTTDGEDEKADAGTIGGTTCDDFFTCICGSAAPSPNDDEDCVGLRGVVDDLRASAGVAATDAYCASQLALAPAAAEACGLSRETDDVPACDALVLCDCPSLTPSASDSKACQEIRLVADQQRAFSTMLGTDGCANLLAIRPCDGPTVAGVDAGADAGSARRDAQVDSAAAVPDACEVAEDWWLAASSALDNDVDAVIGEFDACTTSADCVLTRASHLCEGLRSLRGSQRAIARSSQGDFQERVHALGAPLCHGAPAIPQGCQSASADPIVAPRCTSTQRCEAAPLTEPEGF